VRVAGDRKAEITETIPKVPLHGSHAPQGVVIGRTRVAMIAHR
jgi:hypothetical protein